MRLKRVRLQVAVRVVLRVRALDAAHSLVKGLGAD